MIFNISEFFCLVIYVSLHHTSGSCLSLSPLVKSCTDPVETVKKGFPPFQLLGIDLQRPSKESLCKSNTVKHFFIGTIPLKQICVSQDPESGQMELAGFIWRSNYSASYCITVCSSLPSTVEYKYLTFLTKMDRLKLHTMISLDGRITSLFMIITNYSGEMANLIGSYYLYRV